MSQAHTPSENPTGNASQSAALNDGLVSVIMPCFNRATFLREAIGAVHQQTYTHWELIIVDDGSSDNTKEVLDELVKEFNITQPVRYEYQDNAGPYAARNTGLKQAAGQYIALYDSDDLWLPHHLTDGVDALVRHPQIDWVYADSTKVDLATGNVVTKSGFRQDDIPHCFLRLNVIRDGKLCIFDDPAVVACQIRDNLCCLLQTSVIRATVFQGHLFVDHYRNEGEDELYPARAMKRGFKLAYFDDVHLIYRFHQENSSTAAIGASVDKRMRVTAAAARGYEEFAKEVTLNEREQAALNHRLANEYFWKRGYATLWENGRAKEAWREFHKGLRYEPGNKKMWRAYFSCRFKSLMGKRPAAPAAADD